MLLLASSLALSAPIDCLDAAGSPANDAAAAGLRWVARRRYDEAVPCFRIAVEDQPDQAAWANLGSALHDRSESLFRSGDTAGGMADVLESLHAIERATALGPTPPEAALLQSSNLAILGRSEEATELVREALSQTKAPRVRMALLQRLGRLSQVPYPEGPEAIAFDTAQRRGAEAIRPYIDSGWVDAKARAEVEQGIESLNQALALHPRSWSALWMLGKAHEALGETEQAHRSFERAYALHPSHPGLAIALAESSLHRDLFAAARISEGALRLFPEDPAVIASYQRVRTVAAALSAPPDELDRRASELPEPDESWVARHRAR